MWSKFLIVIDRKKTRYFTTKLNLHGLLQEVLQREEMWHKYELKFTQKEEGARLSKWIITELIFKEDMTVHRFYVPKNRALKYKEKIKTELWKEISESSNNPLLETEKWKSKRSEQRHIWMKWHVNINWLQWASIDHFIQQQQSTLTHKTHEKHLPRQRTFGPWNAPL